MLERQTAIARIVSDAEERRARLREATSGRRVEHLPLRFWRQQAHYTTPAAEPDKARKAVENGYAPIHRLLERFDIAPADLAAHLGVPDDRVQRVLDRTPPVAPLVMLDGEDATAPREDVVQRARESAADVFREAHWHPSTLRFYRPSGLDLPWTAADLSTVLLGAGPGAVDGIIFPKAEHPEEVQWLDETLGAVERELGVPDRSIKVELLIESGWAVRNLERLTLAALPRLVGLILGIADYSSDVGLREIRNDHPLGDWVRMQMVNMAGAVGVPAIDTMSFDYPVADPGLTPALNRARILDRLKSCYDATTHAMSLGMSGKWVGHPAQLFAVLLAFEGTLEQSEIDAALADVRRYQAAVDQEQGAIILGAGQMADRATDRHAREILRRALALGRLAPEMARAIGLAAD